MKQFLIFLIVSTCFLACNSSAPEEKQTTNDAVTPKQVTPPPTQALYPSIPGVLVQKLYKECDFLDVIFNGSFHGVSMSLSQDQQNDIRQSLSFITKTPAQINPACKTVGRMFFLKQGETLLEADFYLQEHCTYFIFYENKVPKYANQMSEQGVKYLLTMIQKAGTVRGQ